MIYLYFFFEKSINTIKPYNLLHLNSLPLASPTKGCAMILTRFLYAKDEVELSLLTALLKKEDLRIIYYWAYELYYSGFETELFEFLGKIYLDFYYVHQPYFLGYFIKKRNLWKADKNVNHVAYIIRNMYNLKADGGVFMIRQKFTLDLSPTNLYKIKNKNTNIFDSYDKRYHN